jgi:UDP-N-acetylglucosamine--N-acetylmuramyl-(pentapeptide) pyrophosphoryl-undecaprenol N-acetylglucosamine transferase
MAIAELCVVQKPVIFVPYPYAAEDHQAENARRLVQKNAAFMVMDSVAKEKLMNELIGLAANEQKQNELKNNIGKLAITNADALVAEQILKIING